MSDQWRVSFTMWPHHEPIPRDVERFTNDEADAREQMDGLLLMLAPHGLQPCDDHVWMPRLERRKTNVRRYSLFVCPGCGWSSDRTTWCCGQPQCRFDDPLSPTGTNALACEVVDVVAVDDLPEEARAGLLAEEWELVLDGPALSPTGEAEK